MPAILDKFRKVDNSDNAALMTNYDPGLDLYRAKAYEQTSDPTRALAAATRRAWAWRGSLPADSTADRVAYTPRRTRTRSPARVSDRNCAGVIPAARHSPAVPTVFLRTAAGTSLNVTIVSICHHARVESIVIPAAEG